ncbi:MAG: response regulator transcription factor [Acidobacteria bacterium]|nr:response regulator transcription factor [Acidobacteriota bacterium]
MMQGENEPQVKVLVVDDEPQITRVLRMALTSQGYSVKVAGNGAEGLAIVRAWKPDLVVTDLAMPQMNGVELCETIRVFSQVPIIILSVRDQEKMKVEALDAGANDYVTKPFGMQELQARIRVQLRGALEGEPQPAAPYDIGDFHVDVANRHIAVRGQHVHLTPKQFELLMYFLEHADRVLTHRTLLHAVWGSDVAQPEYLRVHIGQLRKKIELGEQPRYILTEPWVGYRFLPTGAEAVSL